MHRYKVDAVVTTIIETREQLEKLKEIFPTMADISLDVSEDEKKIILSELRLLEIVLDSLKK